MRSFKCCMISSFELFMFVSALVPFAYFWGYWIGECEKSNKSYIFLFWMSIDWTQLLFLFVVDDGFYLFVCLKQLLSQSDIYLHVPQQQRTHWRSWSQRWIHWLMNSFIKTQKISLWVLCNYVCVSIFLDSIWERSVKFPLMTKVSCSQKTKYLDKIILYC